MIRRLLYSIIVFSFIAGLAGAIILYSRGYRLDLNDKTLSTTGILSISSYPDKASILIDGKLVSATSASLSLLPNWYNVEISSVGYQSWEKKIRVQGEVVTQIDALLIPANPSLRAITVTGVENVTLSPSRSKVAYFVSADESAATSSASPKTGIWVLDLRTGILGGRAVPKQVLTTKNSLESTKIIWSPDEKQLIAASYNTLAKKETLTRATLIPVEDTNTANQDITNAVTNLIYNWESEVNAKLELSLAVLPPVITDTLKSSTKNIVFSPDDTKILYLATGSARLSPAITPALIGSNPTPENRNLLPGNYYIYDTKEDKNYSLTDEKSHPDAGAIVWYSDSKHLAMIENDSIIMVDYDNTNKRTVYSGPFEKNLLFSWPQGGKLVILTSLNHPQTLPNLYELDLR